MSSSAEPTLDGWITVAKKGKKRKPKADSSPELEKSAASTEGSLPSSSPPKPPRKRAKGNDADTKTAVNTSLKSLKSSKGSKPPKQPTKKAAWDAEIKARGKWTHDENEPYKQECLTITKTEALKYIKRCDPKLTERELLTLPFEMRTNPKDKDYTASHEYAIRDIDDLVREKAKALGVLARVPGQLDPPPQAGPSHK